MLTAAFSQLLGHACTQELLEKPTSLEEDEDFLQARGKDADLRLWSALHLRMGHKHLLKQCIAQATAARIFLETKQLAVQTAPAAAAHHVSENFSAHLDVTPMHQEL